MYSESNSPSAATTLNRQDMATQLVQKHEAFIRYINSIPESEFVRAANGKWTPGQQLQHVLLSVKPVQQAFRLPGFLIGLFFGKANRSSKSYDALVQRYHQKYQAMLEQGRRPPVRFAPAPVALSQRATLSGSLQKAVQQLARLQQRFSEQQLDALILPHPLLGKVTLREMIYFTIYHVQHHHEATKRNLG